MHIEFVVPVGLIICLVERKCIVIDAVVVPLAVFVKQEHLFRSLVSVDHVEVQTLVLLRPEPPRSAPVVVLGDGEEICHWHIGLIDALKAERVHGE